MALDECCDVCGDPVSICGSLYVCESCACDFCEGCGNGVARLCNDCEDDEMLAGQEEADDGE